MHIPPWIAATTVLFASAFVFYGLRPVRWTKDEPEDLFHYTKGGKTYY